MVLLCFFVIHPSAKSSKRNGGGNTGIQAFHGGTSFGIRGNKQTAGNGLFHFFRDTVALVSYNYHTAWLKRRTENVFAVEECAPNRSVA